MKESSYIDKLLLLLLYCYVFLAPFEDLLDYLYGIDTIFKPYRVAGLGILILGFFRYWREKPFFVFPPDKILALFLGYGVLYTLILYGLGKQVSIGQFLNTTIQISFLFLIYLTLKRMDIPYRLVPRIAGIMSLGIAINAFIIALDFYILQLSSREKGLSDNSNYAAFGMAVAASYYLWKIIQNRYNLFKLSSWIYSVMIAFLFLAILATGSRTGFLLFGIGALVLMFGLQSGVARFRMVPYLAVVLAILLSSSAFRQMISTTTTFNRLEHATEDVRVPLAKAGVEALWQSKFMGIGVAQMMDQKNFKKFMAPVDERLVRAIEKRKKGLGLHNMYLELTVESGIIGISLFFFFLYRVLRYQFRMIRTASTAPADGKNGPSPRAIHKMLFTFFLLALLMGLTGKGILGALFWFMYFLASTYFVDEELEGKKQVV